MTEGATRDRSLAEMVEELDAATAELKRVLAEIAAARSRETTAMNRLNRAQQALDQRIESLREFAPRESDWGRPKVRRLLA